MKRFEVRRFAVRGTVGAAVTTVEVGAVEEAQSALGRLAAIIAEGPPNEVDELSSHHWITVVFQTRAQKEEFLRAVDLLRFADLFFPMSWAAPHLLGSAPPPPVRRTFALRGAVAEVVPGAAEESEEAPRTGFLGRADAEKARMVACTDTAYWISLTFMSEEERSAFVAQWEARWGASMRLDAEWCCDGLALAEAMGARLTAPTPDWAGMGKRRSDRMRALVG